MRYLNLTVAIPLLAAWLAGCTGIPDGVTPVSDFELQRYLGTWYEIARLDHRFERGLSKVTAEYSMRPDGGVKVVNRGLDATSDIWKESVGKAYLLGSADTGQLKVSFFGPFYGGYNIIALEREGYQYAMVAGPNTSYLWILSRTPQLPQATVERLVEQAQKLGFPVAELIFVDQR